MPSRAPLVVVLAGPNGAGKSTSAAHLLRGALSVHDNADLVGPRLIASRTAGTGAVIADPNAWENLKEQQQ